MEKLLAAEKLEESVWQAYINFEKRHIEVERASAIRKRFETVHLEVDVNSCNKYCPQILTKSLVLSMVISTVLLLIISK